MKFSATSVLPLVGQLGSYLKMGADHYSDLKQAGTEAGPDLVAVFLQAKMGDWDPQVNGQAILDEATKEAGARFLAGVAVNLVS
tara:strand:+ start:2232 stop:2483 length:252 start_codon:yes stop_codon:yes gene_type:complete